MTAVFILAAAYTGLLLLRAGLAAAYARTLPAPDENPLAPSTMTVAQAILSGDPLLESCLESNLITLPGQNFLWLIDEEDGEAQRIAEVLRARHPLAAVRVERCPPCPDATNPKLWKLKIAAPLIETPLLCVLDDDTTLPAASAAALASGAQSQTIATGLPCYLDADNLPSGLIAQFVNNNSVFTYLGTSCVLPAFTLNGMGYVLRREELARLQDFQTIQYELTDDLAVATLVIRNGGSIHQSTAPLHVQTGVGDFAHYMRLMHRWYLFALLLLRRQSIAVQMLVTMLHGLPPILLVALLAGCAATGTVAGWGMLALVVGGRLLIIAGMHRRFFGRRLHRPWLSIVSELLQLVHLIHALSSRTVRWRTRRYRVRDADDFVAVT